MAVITGGRVSTPRGLLTWRPVRPVAEMYQFYTTHGSLGYVCAGVIGNLTHLGKSKPEDHTPYSQDDVWIGGKHYVPKAGWVYAIDGHTPNQALFEKWFIARLRAGYYGWVKYFNINNHHWRKSDGWKGATYSGDPHLHISVMPGQEYTAGNPFPDFEVYRTSGRNVAAKPIAPAPAKPGVLDAAILKLPTGMKKGSTGPAVKLGQAALIALSLLPKDEGQVDGVFGDHTDTAVKKQQAKGKLPQTGVIDKATWDMLFPEQNPTVSRGDTGYYPLLMQSLLLARGFDPKGLDGNFGDGSVTALKRFQLATKVKNSVVRGNGDGIGGANTWVSLVTV